MRKQERVLVCVKVRKRKMCVRMWENKIDWQRTSEREKKRVSERERERERES